MSELVIDSEANSPSKVEMVEVIRVTFNRGRGTTASVVRNVTRYYAKSGELLAEYDPSPGRPGVAKEISVKQVEPNPERCYRCMGTPHEGGEAACPHPW